MDAAWLDTLEPGQRVIVEKGFHDFWWFAEHTPIKIKDKETTELVVMRPRYAQRYVWARLATMARQGRLVRALIPKSRQLGMTTMFLADMYHKTTTKAGREAYVLMHDLTPAAKAYGRLATMRKHQLEMFQPALESYETGRRMTFKDTESTIVVESVRKRGVGRSETLHYVHATELPSWDDPESVMDGIEESVPDLDRWRTQIVLESTSEGVGDWWYWKCQQAKQEKGQYELIFLPWWLEPFYQRTPLKDELRKEPLTAQEEDLGKLILREAPSYGIMDLGGDEVIRKLLWRRSKIENRGYEKFCQEYPANLEESFRGTGRPVFLPASVRWHRNREIEGVPVVTAAPRRLEVVNIGPGTTEGKSLWKMREAAGGPLHLWKGYEPDQRYVLPADSASGQAKDRSAIHILRVEPEVVEQVGVWHGHIGAKQLAYILAYLSRTYGNGLMVPESTGSGLALVETFDEIRYPGRRLYQRQLIDQVEKRELTRYGLDMNHQIREAIIETIYEMLRSDKLILRHSETIAQLEQFAYNKKGRAEAPSGGYDDLVMSLGIGLYARHAMSSQRAKVTVARGAKYEVSKAPSVRMTAYSGP